MCVLYVMFGFKMRPRTFGCVVQCCLFLGPYVCCDGVRLTAMLGWAMAEIW